MKTNRLTTFWRAGSGWLQTTKRPAMKIKGVLLGLLFCFLLGIVLISIKQPFNQAKIKAAEEQVYIANKSGDTNEIVSKGEVGGDIVVLDNRMPRAVDAKTLPLPSGPIKQEFGWQYYTALNDWRYHTGVDIGKQANEKVLALKAGQVAEVYNDRITGLTVKVKCGADEIYYGSLSQALVSQGDAITAGKVVGIAGKSNIEGFIHVHLAVRHNDNFTDPCQFFTAGRNDE